MKDLSLLVLRSCYRGSPVFHPQIAIRIALDHWRKSFPFNFFVVVCNGVFSGVTTVGAIVEGIGEVSVDSSMTLPLFAPAMGVLTIVFPQLRTSSDSMSSRRKKN